MKAESRPVLPSHRFPSSAQQAIGFYGRGASLFGIQVVNLFFNLLTLGIYSFWGRVRVRKYLAGQTEFAGDRFDYHGTGRELFIGWLKALGIFGIPIFGLVFVQVLLGPQSPYFVLPQVVLYAVAILLVPVATVNARRYRLSRLSWRGIRFSFRGRVRECMTLFFKGWLLAVVTLGLHYPFWQTRKQAFLTGHSYIGNEKFDFDGAGRDLFRKYLLHLALTLPTFGLCWIWYSAAAQRYFAESTSLQSVRFRSTVTGGALFGLWSVNALLLVATLGLAWSWIVVRNARFYLGHLIVDGALDGDSIVQQAQEASATGDALSGFLNLDFDLG